MKNTPRFAIIGFGEVGQILGQDLLAVMARSVQVSPSSLPELAPPLRSNHRSVFPVVPTGRGAKRIRARKPGWLCCPCLKESLSYGVRLRNRCDIFAQEHKRHHSVWPGRDWREARVMEQQIPRHLCS